MAAARAEAAAAKEKRIQLAMLPGGLAEVERLRVEAEERILRRTAEAAAAVQQADAVLDDVLNDLNNSGFFDDDWASGAFDDDNDDDAMRRQQTQREEPPPVKLRRTDSQPAPFPRDAAAEAAIAAARLQRQQWQRMQQQKVLAAARTAARTASAAAETGSQPTTTAANRYQYVSETAQDGGDAGFIDVSTPARQPLSRAKCFIGSAYEGSDYFLQIRDMVREITPLEVMEALAAGRKAPTGRYVTAALIHEYVEKATGNRREFATNFSPMLFDGLIRAIRTIRGERLADPPPVTAPLA